MSLRAELWTNGRRIGLRRQGVFVNGILPGQGEQDVSLGLIEMCLVGLHLSIDTKAQQIQIVPDRRFGGGAFVSGADRMDRLRRGVDKWIELQGRPTIGL